MKSYKVRWTIDIDADSPEEAVRIAYEIQRDPESTATLFNVGGQVYDAVKLGESEN